MRLLACFLLAAFLLPPLGAGELGTDATGDQEVGYRPTHASAQGEQWMQAGATEWYPYADIVKAGIVGEDDENLFFELQVQSMSQPVTEPAEFYFLLYAINFTFHDEPRRIAFYASPAFDWAYGALQHEENGHWISDHGSELEAPSSGVGWRYVLPKFSLRDSSLVPARAGDVLSGVEAGVWNEEDFQSIGPLFAPTLCPNTAPTPTRPETIFGYRCGFRVRDPAPGLPEYTLQTSPGGLGHLFLEAPQPLRASNGLATTYLYNLTLFNLGDQEDRVMLQVGDAPSDWVVHLPTSVSLAPHEIKPVPVAVEVPFRHTHGDAKAMEVRAQSTLDKAVSSSTAIGVVWTAIPQPSGHHPQLYFHASDWGWGWMNAAAYDPDQTNGSHVEPNWYSSGTLNVEAQEVDLESIEMHWDVQLNPGLAMGLDFDMTRAVTGELSLMLAEDASGKIELRLEYYSEANGYEPVVLAAQEPQEFTAVRGESFDVPVNMALRQEADRIPLASGYSTILLAVNLTGATAPGYDPEDFLWFTGQEPVYPRLLTDTSRLDLPLFDFHDAIPQEILDGLASLRIENTTEVNKGVNPGRTAAFGFEVSNVGSKAHTVSWEVSGANADWATVYPAVSEVPGKGSGTVLVTVQPPADALDGETADLVLVGTSQDSEGLQVFARLVAIVTTGGDIPDEADVAKGLQKEAAKTEKESPAPAAALALAAALAVAASRRRRA